jgi:hypothetical protein
MNILGPRESLAWYSRKDALQHQCIHRCGLRFGGPSLVKETCKTPQCISMDGLETCRTLLEYIPGPLAKLLAMPAALSCWPGWQGAVERGHLKKLAVS